MTVSLIRGIVRPSSYSSCLLFEHRLLATTTSALKNNNFFCSSKTDHQGDLQDKSTKEKTNLKTKYSRAAVQKKVNKYVFSRYIDYVKNYDKILEKNFPNAVHVYRIFFDGVREFLSDMKSFLKINRILLGSPKGLDALTRKELELYLKMPKDMLKVAPTLLFTAIPVIGNVAFPIAYMFPRILLSTHFWTIQQKSEFQLQSLKERLTNNRKVFRFLQAKLNFVKNDPLIFLLNNTIALLGSGQHPTANHLILIKNIFAKPPYEMASLGSNNIKYLCKIHGVRGGPFKRSRLIEHALIINHMDRAIQREGNVHNMSPDALRYACYLRGLNPSNMCNEDMIDWLKQWVKVSLAIEKQHISLFLHLPILIGYNHPNNWILTH